MCCCNGMPLSAPNLCLITVDTIYEPIAAIPDEGDSPGDFLFSGELGTQIHTSNRGQ